MKDLCALHQILMTTAFCRELLGLNADKLADELIRIVASFTYSYQNIARYCVRCIACIL